MQLRKNTLAVALLCGAMPLACLADDPVNPFSSYLVPGQRVGLVLLSRTTALSPFGGNVVTDEGLARFIDVNATPTYTPPAPGSCAIYQGWGLNGFYGFPFGDGSVLQVVSGPLFGRDLHAGPSLTVSGNGSRNIPGGGPYFSTFGTNLGGGGGFGFGFFSWFFNNSLYLNPGNNFSVSGPGGPDVGPFTVGGTLENSIQWNNSGISTVNRSNPLTISWSGTTEKDYVMILGVSGNTEFFCNATGSKDNSFPISADTLQALPGAFGWFGFSSGVLAVGTIQQIGTFTADKIDAGGLFSGNIIAKTVTFK